MSKRGGGGRPWQEIDLNRVFNRFGYSLGWGRELFRRLTLDPFFRNLCKVRFIQKRLDPPEGHGNGCFVVLVAFRPYLKWDEEPLYYDQDRQQARHIRANLRAEDLELWAIAPNPRPKDPTQDCPVSDARLIKTFSTQRTAVENNNRASAEDQSTGFAACKTNPPTSSIPSETTKPELRHSLNNAVADEVTRRKDNNCPDRLLTSAATSATTAATPTMTAAITKTDDNAGETLNSKLETRNDQASRLLTSAATTRNPKLETRNPTLRNKAIALTLQIKAGYWQGETRNSKLETRNRPQTQVPFSFPHVYAFVSESLAVGYLDKTIAMIWQRAVHETHADLVDSNIGRRRGQPGYRPEVASPQALNLFHARRLLAETDGLSAAERIKKFYRGRMIENERARKRHAEFERSQVRIRTEIENILEGTSQSTISEQFKAIKQSLDNGLLAKAVECRKSNPIKNE